MNTQAGTPSSLAADLKAHTGRFTDKTFDWDAFPSNAGYADLARAQMRYIGAGGSPKGVFLAAGVGRVGTPVFDAMRG